MKREGPLPHSQMTTNCTYPVLVHVPHPTSWRSTLILSYQLRPGLSSVLFLSGFTTKSCIRLSSPHTYYIPCPSPFLDFITRTILCEQYRSLSSSFCSFLHSLVTSSLLGQNILNTLFFYNLSLSFSLNVSDQVSYPHPTTVKIIIIYIYIYIWAGLGRNQSSVRQLVWLWYAASWANS
jgi:hypothetical protein